MASILLAKKKWLLTLCNLTKNKSEIFLFCAQCSIWVDLNLSETFWAFFFLFLVVLNRIHVVRMLFAIVRIRKNYNSFLHPFLQRTLQTPLDECIRISYVICDKNKRFNCIIDGKTGKKTHNVQLYIAADVHTSEQQLVHTIRSLFVFQVKFRWICKFA